MGEDTCFQPHNIVEYFNSDDEVAHIEACRASVSNVDTDPGRIVTRAEIDALLPGAASGYKYAYYIPTEGIGESALSAPAIVIGARKFGAGIYQNTTVRGSSGRPTRSWRW